MDPRVTELHCIMRIGDVPSVLERGILSHARAARLRHRSAAMPPVQDGRDLRSVPQGMKLHEYANLYFHARNPTLFERQDEASALCVLRVSPEVLELPGTVLTDGDAASDYVRYLAPSQWEVLDFDDIYATDWRHPGDPARSCLHKSRKCAEVLVPDRVEPRFLTGAYVVDPKAETLLKSSGFGLPVEIDPSLFRPE